MNRQTAPHRRRELAEVDLWLRHTGLEGIPSEALLEGFCKRLVKAGIALMRAQITMRAHHPEFGGLAFTWQHEEGSARQQFARSDAPDQNWLQSPFFHLMEIDELDMRIPLGPDDPPSRFPYLNTLKSQGATDYFCSKVLFGPRPDTLITNPLDPPEGMLVSLACNGPGGFSDDELDGLRDLILTLGLALKSGSNRVMAHDLLATYLGADAGRRVMSGAIQRGSSETLEAVILYFDLQGFTAMSEALPGADIIEMLNAYFGEMVAITENHGGNVLKFMGDGFLAIFPLDADQDARLRAVQAVTEMRARMAAINAARQADDLPVTGFTAALHAGDVLYGNIGGRNRLDFTVIGPAVNTTARVLSMSGPLGQPIVVSQTVAAPLRDRRADIVSLGQYRLRGVAERLELFTLD